MRGEGAILVRSERGTFHGSINAPSVGVKQLLAVVRPEAPGCTEGAPEPWPTSLPELVIEIFGARADMALLSKDATIRTIYHIQRDTGRANHQTRPRGL